MLEPFLAELAPDAGPLEATGSAGATFDIVTNCDTFQGTTAATTPTGSWRTMTSPNAPVRASSHSKSLAIARKVLSIIQVAGAWPRFEKVIGDPISSVITVARSSSRAAYALLNRSTAAIRSSTGAADQSPASKVVRAAATALSTSSTAASGTRAMTSSVWGETTSIRAPVAGATHSPPM